jgi:hypothetical protein
MPSTVVRKSDGDQVMTDGPFDESKEYRGRFYIINADDFDAALLGRARSWTQPIIRSMSALRAAQMRQGMTLP